MHLPSSQRGSILTPILLFIAIVAIAFSYRSYQKLNTPPPSPSPTPLASPLIVHLVATDSAKLKSSLWKIYQDDQGRFQVVYPAQGIILNKGSLSTGACGKAIRETNNSLGSDIIFDNLFGVTIQNWPGSIEDYLKVKGLQNSLLAPIEGANADQAFAIVSSEQPKNEIKAVYRQSFKLADKKEANLITLYGITAEENSGCVPFNISYYENKKLDLKESEKDKFNEYLNYDPIKNFQLLDFKPESSQR